MEAEDAKLVAASWDAFESRIKSVRAEPAAAADALAGAAEPQAVRRLEVMAKLSGLTVKDLRIGEGSAVVKGSTVRIRYDGYLNRGDRFQEQIVVSFKVGKRQIIAGLEQGIVGMRVGGLRQISVGPHLAYREIGVPGVVPPHAKLVFQVELLEAENA